MFIELLTEEEQKIFLELALELEKVAEERCEVTKQKLDTFVSRIVKESGGDIEELNVDVARLERPLAKKVVLLELITLGYASGEYCDRERAYLRDVASKIGVDTEGLEQIEDWVQGFVSHINSGANIVNNQNKVL